MKNVFFLIILILVNINSKDSYDYLLEWGKNNSLEISDKLGMRYINENNKTYYAKEDIDEYTIIMKIPFNLMLNVKNALKLLNNKKLSKLYEEYKKDEFKIKVGFLHFSVDQSFLAYLMYLVNRRQNHYKKNKFYQYFHYLIDTFETNLDNFPIFYNKKQLNVIKDSRTFMQLILMKELFEEEVDKLEHKHNRKSIDFDEYLRFRTLTISKSVNISNITSIVPFIDMFPHDPADFNIVSSKNDTLKTINLITFKRIKKGDILYLEPPIYDNIKRFILYGETFKKVNEYVESFQMPLVSPKIYKLPTDKNENFDYFIDLTGQKFYKKALKTYKKLSVLKKEDGSNLSAYKLFLNNLEFERQNYNQITNDHINEQFLYSKDIYNVKTVLDLEKNYLDKKIRILREYIDRLEKKKKKKLEEKNKDL